MPDTVFGADGADSGVAIAGVAAGMLVVVGEDEDGTIAGGDAAGFGEAATDAGCGAATGEGA